MTDEQVKQGLECCIDSNFDCSCKPCPYFGDCYSTSGQGNLLYKDALVLIKRLEDECADKERYTIELYNRARDAERKVKELEERFAKFNDFGQMTTPIGLLPVNDDGMRKLVDYCGQIRKETAKEILQGLKIAYKARAKEYTNWDTNKVTAVTLEWLNADISEVAQDYGVEVEQ